MLNALFMATALLLAADASALQTASAAPEHGRTITVHHYSCSTESGRECPPPPAPPAPPPPPPPAPPAPPAPPPPPPPAPPAPPPAPPAPPAPPPSSSQGGGHIWIP